MDSISLCVGGSTMKMDDLYRRKKTETVTLRIPKELKEELDIRADKNLSTISKEIILLVMQGLAVKTD